jgi:3-hydroxymyristoyl/3-hydroxydecanoyl-(acyl carrier protein) dehydratase
MSQRNVMPDVDASHRHALCIGNDHPALAGHFPGNPVVPGVVLLDHVLDAVEAWLGALPEPLRLPQIKFLQPLLPEQPAEIAFERNGARLRFRITRGEELIASGELDATA